MNLEQRVEALEAENKKMKSTIEQLEARISSTNCSALLLEANISDAKNQMKEKIIDSILAKISSSKEFSRLV